MSRKQKVARLSIWSNSGLIALKFAAGFSTGSVSIISEAVHSLMDLVAAIVAYFSVRFADRPPDESHPYGHEKMENVSGVIETILIFVACGLIIKEAVHKLTHRGEVEMPWLGFLVMAVSAAVNIIVSRKLYRVAREEGSVAIEADALHLKTDVYTSVGVAVGLLLLWITDWHVLDPVVAILIAAFILREAWDMMVHSFGPLMDARLPENELAIVRSVLATHAGAVLEYHELRTRRSGNIKHIDLHLTMPAKITLQECHRVCDAIERDLERRLTNTKVLIHSEPCLTNCPPCEFPGKNTICK